LLRLLVLLAVVGVVTVVGLVAALKDWPYAVVVALPPLLLLLLRRLDLTPLLILIVAAFVPFSLSTGTESRLVASLLLTMACVGLWVFRAIVIEKRLALNPSPVNVPLIGFMVVTVVSLVWSMVFRDPLVVIWGTFPLVQLASTAVMIMLPCALLLVANHIEGQGLLKAMMVVFLAAGFLGLVREFFRLPLPVNADGLFTMWVVTLSISLALFDRQMSWIVRGLLIVMAGGWVYWRFGLHITWVSGWLPPFVALGIVVLVRSKKLFAVLVLAVAIVAIINLAYLVRAQEEEMDESGHSRLEAWVVNWRVTGKHLLLGTGPGGYAAYYMSYFPHEAMASHSNLIDVAAQTGLVGLFFCVWFFASLAWTGYRLVVRVHGRGDFVEALSAAGLAGTVGCIVALGLGDWLLPFAYTQTIAGFDHAVYSWLFMGMVLALDRFTQSQTGAWGNA
jgi:hypothetical protein